MARGASSLAVVAVVTAAGALACRLRSFCEVSVAGPKPAEKCCILRSGRSGWQSGSGCLHGGGCS